MKVAILGAGGIIAPAIVRDLAESPEIDALHLLDVDRGRAQAVADAHGGGKAQVGTADARDPQALALALEGFGLLVNAASYRVNLTAMDGALLAGSGYVDLGGLYHVTRTQLARHDEFAERGLLAILGCGAGPGKTNMMAARAAAELDDVHAIRTASAGMDETPPEGLSTPYALATLLDEVTLKPIAVRDGAEVELAPLSSGGDIVFPEPFGARSSVFTLHSEPLTLPGSLHAPDCDFRLAMAPPVEAALRELATNPPAELPRPAPPSARTWSAQRVDVSGIKDGAPLTITVTALTPPHEAWGLGGGIVSTGSVAAATARLYARGTLAHAGVLPPEAVLTPDALFAELETRGTIFDITTQSEAPA